MKLLITGASGFIGSRLLALAAPKYGKNHVIALTSTQIPGYTCVLHRGYQFQKEDFIEQGISHIDAVIHLGGFSPRDRSEMNDRGKYFESIRSTHHLMENLPNVPDVFLFGSTISVYDETGDEVITEKTVPAPATLYGMYKLYCEKLVSCWGADVGCRTQIVRIGNVYGPGEGRYRYVIPLMLRRAMEGKELSIYVEPHMRRNYIYVDDVCRMILQALELKKNVGPINLVSKRHVGMQEIAEAIVHATGSSAGWTVAENLVEGKDILFSNQKAALLLGEDQTSFEEGILKEAKSFKE